jgi:hypothetical protein
LLSEPLENDLGVVVHFANDLGGRLYLPNERNTLARP